MRKSKYVKVPVDDFHALIISSQRYAMGRQSYIVSWIVQIISDNVHHIKDLTLYVLLREINHPLSNYGNEQIDKPEWMYLKRVITKELNKRDKKNIIQLAKQ